MIMQEREKTKIILKKDIIIPAGTVLKQASWKTLRNGYHGECIIGFGPDGTGYFTIDIESAKLNPEDFQIHTTE